MSRSGVWVYVARRDSDGAFKIGASGGPAMRVRELGYGKPYRLALLFTLPGVNEWFAPTTEVLAAINRLCALRCGGGGPLYFDEPSPYWQCAAVARCDGRPVDRATRTRVARLDRNILPYDYYSKGR